MISPRVGSMIEYDTKNGVSAFLQHRVVGVGTHEAIIGYPQLDIPVVFESDQRVSYDLWMNYLAAMEDNMRVYEIIGATEEGINYAMKYCIKNFLGDGYGYTEWLWFAYKQFNIKILRKDIEVINKQSNWFKNWIVKGMICTELGWWFKSKVAEYDHLIKLTSLLSKFSPDTMTARDAWKMAEDNADVFRLVFQRWDKVMTSY